MKAFISVLVLVLVAAAAAFLITGKTGGSPVSQSEQAVSLCEEGTADLNAFRLNAARDKLLDCLELDPNLAEASISLAFTYARLGLTDEFEKTVARADSLVSNIQDDDRRMMAQLRLSSTYGESYKSKFTSIRDSLLTRLQVEKPDNIHVLVAMTEQTSGDPEKEERAWLRVMEADPNYAVTYNMLGYMELNRGNYEQAIEHMQKYAFLSPDLANPYDSFGDVYFAQGRYEEAEAAYVKSVTLQPDFYVSLINLGRTYLARGQVEKGFEILEKVRTEVAGSDLEKKVDQEILQTLVQFNIEEKLGEIAKLYIVKWPKDYNTAAYRAMTLAYSGKFPESQAVMDSALTMWRLGEGYKNFPKFRKIIDQAGKRYQALVADMVDPPQTRVRHWAGLVAMNSDLAIHHQWHDRWKLGEALLDNNQPDLALEQILPLLEVNQRLINPLLLAVRINLAQNNPTGARGALEQAKWALSKADRDFPPVATVVELERKVTELEGSF